MMRRTIGVILIVGCLLPLTIANAQPVTKIPSVAVLSPADATALSDPKRGLYAFQQGLRELGYVEGQNIHLEYRFAEWQWDRLPRLAAELVHLQPDVLVTHTTPAALVAKQARTIPVADALAEELVRLRRQDPQGRQIGGSAGRTASEI